jgi:hypothetical protein
LREREKKREREIEERKEEREREKAPFLTSDKTSKWSCDHSAQRCPVTNVDHLWWLLCSSSWHMLGTCQAPQGKD